MNRHRHRLSHQEAGTKKKNVFPTTIRFWNRKNQANITKLKTTNLPVNLNAVGDFKFERFSEKITANTEFVQDPPNPNRTTKPNVSRGAKEEAEVGQKLEMFKCTFCNTKFDSLHNCQDHEKEHTKGKFKFLNCPSCHLNFFTVKGYNRHLRKKHPPVKQKQQQTSSPESYSTPKISSKIEIIKDNHYYNSSSANTKANANSLELEYECSLCDKVVKDSDSAIRHSLTHSSLLK